MESVSDRYELMMKSVRENVPNPDLELIDQAFEFAREKHGDQLRKDGSLYITHPLATAEIVAKMGLDTDSVIAALLHDCIEDTDCSFEDVEKRFGRTVAELVEGVTKLTRVNFSSMEEEQMENLRKMFMAMSRDIRVILIKLADRLHNTRTMEFQSPEKQRTKSLENMEVYAPLAHRLGIQAIKWELEDSSIKYLDPVGYEEIERTLADRLRESTPFMESVYQKLSQRMEEAGIRGQITYRLKHIYSIYRKMYSQNLNLNEVYDLYAFRVIVDSIPDCYNVLGHVHDMYNLVPGRFKDYISTPKPNGYQSLHTTVIGSEGIPFEVQIRTWEMHRIAEYGVAAHWKYKQNGSGEGSEEKYEWIRRLLENQQDTEAEEYVHNLRIDMFDDEVFVFTPQGELISLTAGSSPIDFAYSIHSEVGNHMIGAKINGRIVSYDTKLQNGDIVEIITSKTSKGPSRDWLNLCKSNQARNKIKQWFKRERREENIERGRASFEAELRRQGFNAAMMSEEIEAVLLKKVSASCMDDIYASIGYGGMTALKTVNRIRDELTRASKVHSDQGEEHHKLATQVDQKPLRNVRGVIVEDIGDCMIKFARCCTPVPGDDIVGFVTRLNGISVHRRSCPNAAGALGDNSDGRWVKVYWAESPPDNFSTSLVVEATDRDGLALDIATVLASMKLKVTELNCRVLPEGRCLTNLTFEVRDSDELTSVRNKLGALRGVTGIIRGKTA